MTELIGKNAEIADLQVLVHRSKIEHQDTCQELEETRLCLDEIHTEFKKFCKREKRVTREKNQARKNYLGQIRLLNAEKEKIFTDLSVSLSEARDNMDGLRQSAEGLQINLTEARNTIVTLRKKVHSLDMQRRRAQSTLTTTRRTLMEMSNWRPTKRGVYTPEARKLARALLHAGCTGDRVNKAIAACAKAFRVRVTRLMSRWTVFRAQDEGGQYGLMQIAREITQSKGQIHLISCYYYGSIIENLIC